MAFFNFQFSFGNKDKSDNKPVEQPAIETTKQESFSEDIYAKILSDVFKEFDSKLGKGESDGSMQAPVSGGRQSVFQPEGLGLLTNIKAPVPSNFPFETLNALFNLSVYNRHISYAVDNIQTLGNTDYEISFGENVSSELDRKMRMHLRRKVENWYEFANGEASLDNDLLAQLATYGALSAEGTILKDLSGIKSIVMVTPEQIRFAYDRDKDIHIPLQKTNDINRLYNSSSNYPGYVELNTNTYCYVAMRRYKELAYGIPPFISAIEDLLTESDMIKNLKNVMRRMGMLGFLSVLVKAPKANNETPEAYKNKLKSYLADIMPDIENGFNRGISVGFQDTHDFKLEGQNLNASGADQLMKMVKTLIFSGVKQDPNMHGENYSTTETFGRVILTKMTQQVKNYQMALGNFKSRMFQLELILAGYSPEVVEVIYEPAMIGDKKREEETEKLKIENVIAKRNNNFIDQNTAANELGYDEPAGEAPTNPFEQNTEQPGSEPNDDIINEDEQSNVVRSISSLDIARLRNKLYAGIPEFNYFVPEECDPDNVPVSFFKERDINVRVKKYRKDIDLQYNNFLNDVEDGLKVSLRTLVDQPSYNSVARILSFHVLDSFDRNMTQKVPDIAKEHIEPMYSYFRQDTRPFDDAATGLKKTKVNLLDIPDAVFDLLDTRVITMLENMDAVWLGKFITDRDTEERIFNWLRQKFEQGDIELGPDSKTVDQFIDEFSDVLDLERFKIRRIIETTANRTRNYANVMYINQAGIQRYEIVELMDDRTCGWCRHMNGKTFSTGNTVSKIEQLTNSEFRNIGDISPFATTFNLEVFQEMDSNTLEANGISTPSYHPHCRGRIVAVL